MALINQQLNTFIVAAECGSFRKAGEVLYVTPTAVQKQITILEQHLGIQLFVRTHRGLRLTNAGKALYADGRYLLSYAQDSEQRLKVLGDVPRYEVRAVYSPIAPTLTLPAVWKHLHKVDDSYTIALMSLGDDTKTKTETLTGLGTTVDLIETAYDEDRCREVGVGTLLFKRIPLGVVVPITHPLAQYQCIPLSELQKEVIILPVRGLNKHADAVRNELLERGSFSTIEIPDYTVDSYNMCVRENCCMLAINPTPVHPLLVYRQAAWEHTVPYGLLYPLSPSPMLLDFLRLTRQVLRSPDQYADVVSCLP